MTEPAAQISFCLIVCGNALFLVRSTVGGLVPDFRALETAHSSFPSALSDGFDRQFPSLAGLSLATGVLQVRTQLAHFASANATAFHSSLLRLSSVLARWRRSSHAVLRLSHVLRYGILGPVEGGLCHLAHLFGLLVDASHSLTSPWGCSFYSTNAKPKFPGLIPYWQKPALVIQRRCPNLHCRFVTCFKLLREAQRANRKDARDGTDHLDRAKDAVSKSWLSRKTA